MGIWKSLAGTYTVEITSASPGNALTALNNNGIALFDIVYLDALCVRISIYRFSYKQFAKCLSKRGEEWKITERSGLFWTFKNLKNRPVLVFGILLYLITVLYLPTRVLFVQVEGNKTIPTNQIIEQAQMCGIRFGASRRAVRSERMKNALLSAVPQLQWAGVNTVGCVAVISVQERSANPSDMKPYQVNNIVALQDAVVTEITVLRGSALCKTGQAVKKGQILVSGYTDCGILIKADAAEAEIKGKTLRNLDAVSPVNYTNRGEPAKTTTRYSLRFGKNIINFCKDSGISGAECAKMYKEKILTLPGGFRLPLALITEVTYHYDSGLPSEPDSENPVWLTRDAEIYLRNQMVAGRIVDSGVSVQLQGDVYRLKGQYSCLEEIGQICFEEKINSGG